MLIPKSLTEDFTGVIGTQPAHADITALDRLALLMSGDHTRIYLKLIFQSLTAEKFFQLFLSRRSRRIPSRIFQAIELLYGLVGRLDGGVLGIRDIRSTNLNDLRTGR